MLTDEQVLPTCYHWARILARPNQASFDELVNEGYLVGKVLSSPLLLQKWVKWTMKHFIQYHTSLGVMPRDMDVEDASFNFKEFSEIQEELMAIVDKKCSETDKELIYMRFWQHMTYEEIGEVLSISFRAVYFRVQKVLQSLRREYERRAKK